jgi:hypothetical protein
MHPYQAGTLGFNVSADRESCLTIVRLSIDIDCLELRALEQAASA